MARKPPPPKKKSSLGHTVFSYFRERKGLLWSIWRRRQNSKEVAQGVLRAEKVHLAPPPKLNMLRSVLLVLPLVAAQSDWPHLCPNQPNDPWSQVRCPATASCSANGFSNGGGFGCCPWANATSCPSGYQCCPQGSTCNLVSGSGYSAVYTCLGGTAPIGGVTSKCPCKPGASQPPSTTKKNVLVIGVSLSIGYTPSLGTNLSDIAQVVHAPWDTRDGGAEESAYLEQCLDYWLRSPSGIPWTPDVILFNSGSECLVAGIQRHG